MSVQNLGKILVNAQHLNDLSLAAFEKMVANNPDFRPRAGQHDMAACVAATLSRVDLGEHPDPTQAIAVIQAGTGVGKSAAYAATAIAQALKRKTRVLISTATVALQEQLMTKDLPALASSMEQTFVFALAKGRGRYLCKIKLERLAGSAGMVDELFDDSDMPVTKNNVRLYKTMAKSLARGTWDGDRDTLPSPPAQEDWANVAAERHTCTVRHCPHFRGCCYYEARMRLSEAHVIVANHDLVLASLGMKTLPELNNCLVIFDEGHHLPAVALHQFASNMDMGNLRWLDKLPQTLQEVSARLQLPLGEDVGVVIGQLKQVLTSLARMGMDLVSEHTGKDAKDVNGQGQNGSLRFANGVLPEILVDPVTQIARQASGLARVLEQLFAELKVRAREDIGQALLYTQLYARLGAFAPRLRGVVSTAHLLLEHGEQPLAKWLQVSNENGFLTVLAQACPIAPGDLLRQFLWSQVRGAVVTSATLTSCGSFDYFLREAGLQNTPHVQTLEVTSPFDYARQGTLTVVHTMADPRQADTYTREMVGELLSDLAQVQHGALVLFTSRVQMQTAVDALPSPLQEIVLLQGSQPRTRLLAQHAERVASGLPSVIFGMQSFGEGLDLPGALCETVFITKLPFAPPSDPVDEARAEWLRSRGRDPFNELVVPATGIKLLQWTGRAIRSEDDHAAVVCYDKRLLTQGYGRRMLAGLPRYRLQQRINGVVSPLPDSAAP